MQFRHHSFATLFRKVEVNEGDSDTDCTKSDKSHWLIAASAKPMVKNGQTSRAAIMLDNHGVTNGHDHIQCRQLYYVYWASQASELRACWTGLSWDKVKKKGCWTNTQTLKKVRAEVVHRSTPWYSAFAALIVRWTRATEAVPNKHIEETGTCMVWLLQPQHRFSEWRLPP